MRIFTKSEMELIDKMYKSGKRLDDIRKCLHCKEDTLRDYMKDKGYKRRKRNTVEGKEHLKDSRKYHVNESFFNTIDTEEKAYWLGFLYADGNVSCRKSKNGNKKGGTVELTLCEKDKSHLYKFLKSLEANYPLKKRNVKLNDKEFIAYRVSINSVTMVNDLISHGCVPAKSLILKQPILNKELINHFIRGYFDGDGCVSFNNYLGNHIYTILGTKEILNFIKEETNISKNISVRQVKRDGEYKSFYSINISGIKNELIFHKYLYENCSIFLDRKYDKSCKIINYLLNKNVTN